MYVDALILNRVQSVPDEIRRHVEECDHCKGNILGLYEVMRHQADEVIADHPTLGTGVPTRTSFRIPYRIAAIITLGLLGGAFILFFQRTPEPDNARQSAPTPPPEIRHENPVTREQNDLLAEAFVPSSTLDDLTRQPFRSTEAEIITPKNSDTVTFPLRFVWKPAEEVMVLKIVSNKEREVYRKENVRGGAVMTSELRPGLYYWKLLNDEGLVHIGRFFVKPVH